MGIDITYAKQMRDKVGRFATWPVGFQVAIGDYGYVNGPLFEKVSRLDGIQASRSPGNVEYDIDIDAERVVNTDAKAAADAGVANGNALLEVKFRKRAAVSFSAPDGVITRVDDLVELGGRLVELGSGWQRNHFIVIEVFSVPRATILVAQEAGAEIKFEVSGRSPINAEVMANLDTHTSTRASKKMDAKIVGKGPLTPLFQLARLRSHFFKNDELRVYRGANEPTPEVVPINDEYFLETY